MCIFFAKVVICGAFYPNYFHRHRPEKTYEYNQLRKVNNANLFSTVWFEGFPQEHDGTLYDDKRMRWIHFLYSSFLLISGTPSTLLTKWALAPKFQK